MKWTFPVVFISCLPILSISLSAGPSLKTSDTEKRIDELLSKMNLDEKVGQLVQYNYQDSEKYKALIREGKIGSFLNVPPDAATANSIQKIAVEESRLGIPLIYGYDVIHGQKTIFPIPLAESSSWDPVLAERNARVAAREAAACGVRWTFAPMMDIARDPRWGRIAEGAGEDPCLGAAFARARVAGFQGNDLSNPESVAACAKHYAAYGAAEGGRDYNTVDVSEKTLREVYLPPFKAAVDAGAATLMSAFNEIGGMPASANPLTLTRILRQEWGFEGFVVSDWNSVGELISHGVAASPGEAGILALSAGVDMDMEGNIYQGQLARLVREGKLSEKLVDQAVRRILRVKFRLGLFEKPYTDTNLAKSILSKEHMAQALDAARKSIVLLKNDKKLLPLNKGMKSIAVVGPLADSRKDVLGSWSGRGSEENAVSVLEGIREKIVQSVKILYSRGCDVTGSSREGFKDAVKLAAQADAVVAVLGESADMSGEAESRSDLGLPGVQEDLLKELVKIGKPVILVLMNGRPLAFSWAAEQVPAIVESWQLGVQHGRAVADVLFGDWNPAGKLTVSFPRVTGQVPIYYNHKNTGRPSQDNVKWTSKYIDCPSTPLYPFGYGLSYATFKYQDLKIGPETIAPYGTVKVSAVVSNLGNRAGDEIVQLYIRDLAASMTRPVKELKGFKRIPLGPGESKTVEFVLGSDELGLYNPRMEWVVEPGDFQVWVGPSSAEGLAGQFRVVE